MRHSKQREHCEQSPRSRAFQEKLGGTGSSRCVGSRVECPVVPSPRGTLNARVSDWTFSSRGTWRAIFRTRSLAACGDGWQKGSEVRRVRQERWVADWRVFRGLNPQGVERKGYPGFQPPGTSGGPLETGNWFG